MTWTAVTARGSGSCSRSGGTRPSPPMELPKRCALALPIGCPWATAIMHRHSSGVRISAAFRQALQALQRRLRTGRSGHLRRLGIQVVSLSKTPKSGQIPPRITKYRDPSFENCTPDFHGKHVGSIFGLPQFAFAESIPRHCRSPGDVGMIELMVNDLLEHQPRSWSRHPGLGVRVSQPNLPKTFWLS